MYEKDEMIYMERPVSSYVSMDRQKRAKQFAPFQALKGFEHAIQEKSILFVEKKMQPDSIRMDLDRLLQNLPAGESVKVIYYLESSIKPGYGTYLSLCGVPKIISHLNVLEIDGIRIPVEDIAGIEKTEMDESDDFSQ